MPRKSEWRAASRIFGGTLLLAALGMLAGCSTQTVKADRSGNVNLDRIPPEASARMQLDSNQIFVPGEQTNPEVLPVYPAELLPLRLPDQVVCVSFVVNHDGSVSDVKPLHGIAECPADAGSTRPEFVAATVDAVSRWDFFSFQRCTFPPGTPARQQCNGPGATMEQVAVTLAYRFLFSSKSGAGTVQRAQTDR